MASPYRKQPRKAFWRSLTDRPGEVPDDLFAPRFIINKSDRIAAAGSCFAQHISTHLRRRGYQVLDSEPAPAGVVAEIAQQFGYGVYSARYGNIYTARQLLQLVQETRGRFSPADAVWEKKGRFFDAMRPSVEPEGLGSAEEVRAHRADHLLRVRQLLKRSTLLIFTLGLTEAFEHRESGTIYPTAPETIAGRYDPDIHAFKNFTYDEVLADLIAVRKRLKAANPALRFLFTVSPVPLTATASDQHALVATMRSKSVLRAAAGAMYEMFDDVDYFPSYEIIMTPFLGASAFEDDLRSVRPDAVERVMRTFFHAQEGTAEPATAPAPRRHAKSRKTEAQLSDGETIETSEKSDVICEEKLLEAFAK